jgi:hypothetical protein
MSATRRVQVERPNPWSLNEVLMMKVQTAWSLLLFELLTTTLIYVCRWTLYLFLHEDTPIFHAALTAGSNQSDVMIDGSPGQETGGSMHTFGPMH